MSYEYKPMSGVPVWERGQFVYGAGPFAPGGPGGGMVIGPTYREPGPAPGPMSCPQVSGGTLVCVQPPMDVEKGVETGRGWPPEIGPQEEQLMEAGCVATGRRCGGSPRAPAQYWCCPQPGGMPMPFVGTPFPHGFGGMGQIKPSGIQGLGAIGDILGGWRTFMVWGGLAVVGYLALTRLGRPYYVFRAPTPKDEKPVWYVATKTGKGGLKTKVGRRTHSVVGAIDREDIGGWHAKGWWKDPETSVWGLGSKEEAASWLWHEYERASAHGEGPVW